MGSKYDRNFIENIKRSKKFRDTNIIFNQNHFNSFQLNGGMMSIINNFKPVSLEQFSDYYLQYRITNFHEQRPFDLYVQRFSELAQISLNDAYLYAWIYIVYNTYLGYSRENACKTKLCHRFFKVVHTNKAMDNGFAVDYLCYNESNQLVAAYQVKPQSYFTGIANNVSYVMNDFRLNNEKNKAFTAQYGIRVGYITEDNVDDVKYF